jgi:hypothetical protein
MSENIGRVRQLQLIKVEIMTCEYANQKVG